MYEAICDSLPEGSPLAVDKNEVYKLCKQVVISARGLALSHRKITVTNDKLKRDANRVSASSRSNTSLFCKLLVIIRKQHKHRGIQVPKAGTPEFLMHKEVTKLATEFCNEFGIKIEEGYKEYIKLALPKMKNYSIHKFKQLHAAIIREYEALLEIRSDKNPQATQKAHSYYLRLVNERTGFAQGYEKQPEKYAAFVQISATAKQYGVTIEDYIQSQFYAFEWKSGIPDPLQMYGEKAVERLQKYCYEKGIKPSEKTKTINFSAIKNRG